MPRTITRNFNPEGDRYAYDFGHCRYDKGWAQIDTTSDAHYYGNWANPHTRKIFIYAEGDETVIALDTDDEFVEELRNQVLFHRTQEQFKGIDAAHEPTRQRFIELGLADLFHPSDPAWFSSLDPKFDRPTKEQQPS